MSQASQLISVVRSMQAGQRLTVPILDLQASFFQLFVNSAGCHCHISIVQKDDDTRRNKQKATKLTMMADPFDSLQVGGKDQPIC
jgi:hypothetical protein